MSDYSSDTLRARVEDRLARLQATRLEPTEPTPDEIARALWQPDPRNQPQVAAYASRADVVGYGGAAGGGKTDLVLGAALTRHRRSIIFRRTGSQINEMIDRLIEIVGHEDGLNRNDRVWRNLPGGRLIAFGSVPNEHDWRKYAGRPYDLLALDETPEFLEAQVRALMIWNRTTTPGQIKQVLMPFNPPTSSEGEWIIDFFAPWVDDDHPHPAEPGEIRYFVDLDDGRGDIEVDAPTVTTAAGERLIAQRRTFYPARVEDNAHLMATDYASKLDQLPAALRAKYRHGIISRDIADAPLQLIPRAWVIAAQARWLEHRERCRAASLDPITEIGVPLSQTGADVSRGGADSTVIANRYGPYFAPLDEYQGDITRDGARVAALILAANDGRATIAVDAIGIGSSVLDHLAEHHPSVLGLVGNARSGGVDRNGSHTYATDKSGRYRLADRRTELWWRLMEALDPEHGEGLMLPDEPDLRRQLTAARYRVVAGGVKLELKDDLKRRLGRSPDHAEAVIYAWARVAQAPAEPTASEARIVLEAAAAALRHRKGNSL